MALAWLASRWARDRGGDVVAFIVDHGLRAASSAEADLTMRRLTGQGIASEILILSGLAGGAGLSARARRARYAALTAACRARGILHLLVGHHAGDQAETIAMRMLAGSGADGLAGMAELTDGNDVRRLRPLLTVAPADLRALLRARGWGWVEDPSNRDPRWQRARLRAARRDTDGRGPASRALLAAAARRRAAREDSACMVAEILALRAAIHPEGYAVLLPGPIVPAALRALLRLIGGGEYPLSGLDALAAAPRPATIGGVRLLPAGRCGPPGALLVVREAAACGPDIVAAPGAIWDRRFRLVGTLSADSRIGALAAEAALFRKKTALPAAVLHGLPAIRRDGAGVVVPALEDGNAMLFDPPAPASIGLQPRRCNRAET